MRAELFSSTIAGRSPSRGGPVRAIAEPLRRDAKDAEHAVVEARDRAVVVMSVLRGVWPTSLS